MPEIRVLTLTEPWASLVAIGAKTIETRSRPLAYRGPLAIHAAKGMPAYAIHHLLFSAFFDPLIRAGVIPWDFAQRILGYDQSPIRDQEWRDVFPLGKIIAVCEITDCFEFSPANDSRIPADQDPYGDFAYGRYGYVLRSVRRLAEPIPARGSLSLWRYDLPEDVRYAS